MVVEARMAEATLHRMASSLATERTADPPVFDTVSLESNSELVLHSGSHGAGNSRVHRVVG